MDNNLISITIVAYNAEDTLSRTLGSIADQQHVLMEIIFINDASTDSTLKIIIEFKNTHPKIPCMIITNNSNLGITKSRNKALIHTKGNFVAILDSDDYWTSPVKLKTQLDFLLSNPDHGVVGTQMNVKNESDEIIKVTEYETTDQNIRSHFLKQNQFCHSSTLIRKTDDLIYDESLFIWEDYDLFLRLGQKYKLANLPDVMVNYLYKERKDSLSRKLAYIKTELQIIKRYKDTYPNYLAGYLKRVLKYILVLLHLK